jgi:CRP/FNR family transcriptional regulator, cyclic AMP receptor protein
MLLGVTTSDPRVQQLQGTALFGATSDDTVAFVLAKAPRVTVESGHWFFREGERGASIYWLEQGRVAICMKRSDADVELRRLGPGDCFGEVALFDFGPRSASVLALEPCHALEITSGLLREVSRRDLEQFTLLTMNLGRELARRARTAEHLLFELGRAWDAATPVPST